MVKSKQIEKKDSTNVKQKKGGVHKKSHKGSSELDNPKFANMDFMMNLVDSAAKKEEDKVNKKLEKKARVAKIIEEKDAKKEIKAEKKKEKLEQIKQDYLQAKKKKKTDAKKLKIKAKIDAERQKTAPLKKKVRFA